MILQETPVVKHYGIQRKPLPLEPSLLLREANRRRASLSAGNMFEMYTSCQSFIDLKLEFRNDSHCTMVLSFLQGCVNFDICMLVKNLNMCTLQISNL